MWYKFCIFAQEQKYWYEDLGLYVDADCINCFACRKEIRKNKTTQKKSLI